MKVKDIGKIQPSTVFRVAGPDITRELIAQSAKLCGFGNAPHIKGDVSLFSIKLNIEEGVACLCGAGTLCLLNAALEKVFQLEEPYDVVSRGYEEIVFDSPNIEGGSVDFKFTVLLAKETKIRVKGREDVPASKISFACEGFNTRTKQRVVLVESWNLIYFATSGIK